MKKALICLAGCLILVTCLILFIQAIFTVCILTDKNFKVAISEVRKEYGIIHNPEKLTFLVHHTRWPYIDDYFGNGDIFCFFSGCWVGQFLLEDYVEKTKEINEKKVERLRRYFQ